MTKADSAADAVFPRRAPAIAVIDIGKTNVKLALVDRESLAEIAVVTKPNTVLPGPPWPHFDLEGHWAFLKGELARFAALHTIVAVTITTHGASAVLLDAEGRLAAPMLDYEHPGPEALAADYDALRPDFAETGSPRLAMGLNLGAQLHWQLQTDPGLRGRLAHVLTYPQYWGYLLTGKLACDVTSLGCHTDLWNPVTGQWSGLVDRLGLGGVMAPPRNPAEVLGGVTPGAAAETGLLPETPVMVGIHDSNASLYPHVLARQAPFAVVSTGTWVILLAMGGQASGLDPARDLLVNVNALGQPVPSARFMGGREYEVIRAGSDAAPDADDRAQVLQRGLALLPAVEPGTGPFKGRQMRWTEEPGTLGQRALALSWYLALMTDHCLSLIGAGGPVIVEGPFGRNPDYVAMLASLRPAGVEVALSATGTSAGAALLCRPDAPPPQTRPISVPDNAEALRRYAQDWRALVQEPPCA